MSYGLSIFDRAGNQTLSMDDFTIQKLASLNISASYIKQQAGTRTDYILMDVPGYDPATCFVMITPTLYAGYSQPGTPDGWGYCPTYKDLGGTQIAIFTYVNYKDPNGSGYTSRWTQHPVQCIVEVIKVK